MYMPKPAQLRRIESAHAVRSMIGRKALSRIADLRDGLKTVALHLVQLCPDGRELNSALKSLEEAQFWATASIIRSESVAMPETEEGPSA